MVTESSNTTSLGAFESLLHNIPLDKFRLLRLIILQCLQFRIVNTVERKELLAVCHTSLAQILLSATSVCRWAERVLEIESKDQRLASPVCLEIHLSFNMLLSPNRYTILGVVAHPARSIKVGQLWCQNYAVLLAMKRIPDGHIAEELVTEIVNVCLDSRYLSELAVSWLTNLSSATLPS